VTKHQKKIYLQDPLKYVLAAKAYILAAKIKYVEKYFLGYEYNKSAAFVFFILTSRIYLKVI